MCSKFWALYEYKAQIMRTSRYTTWGPGEELGGTQQSLILGGSIIARSSPLPFYIPFLIEKVPLLHTIASLLTAENALFFEIWVNHKTQHFFNFFTARKQKQKLTKIFVSSCRPLYSDWNGRFHYPFIYFS